MQLHASAYAHARTNFVYKYVNTHGARERKECVVWNIHHAQAWEHKMFMFLIDVIYFESVDLVPNLLDGGFGSKPCGGQVLMQ